ncbi:MAG TPA: four helix bundle protein, partial [Bacteroidales bacterium]|nr:four helix bundle protein [Bacteroidales bacterium]
NQLIKAATSTGANYEESQGAGSTADFKNKVRIALKEMRECNYWLKVLDGILSGKNRDEIKNELDYLLDESEQLKRILGSICKPSKKNA